MPKAPTSAAPLKAPRPAARPMSIMCRFTIGKRLDRTFQLGLSRATRFLIGDGKRATPYLRANPVYPRSQLGDSPARLPWMNILHRNAHAAWTVVTAGPVW